MQKISWGIIGCGNVTEMKSGPAFQKVQGSALHAVMRRNAAKAEDYARRHKVERWYSDATQLINDPAVNAIYIATPPLYHEAYTLLALQAGKAVYLEKPMTRNAAEARAIVAAVEGSGLPLSIAHYRRRQPYFLKIKELLDAHTIGRVRFVQLQLLQPYRSQRIAGTDEDWRLNPVLSGGGLFHDLAPHQLDLMIYFFGKWKTASGYATNQGGWYPAADFTTGTIVFENGVVFTGLWSFAVPEMGRADTCTITGTGGSITFGIFDQQAVLLKTESAEQRFVFDTLQHVQQPMIETVVQYFLGTAPNPCSAAEGLSVMELMDAFTAKG